MWHDQEYTGAGFIWSSSTHEASSRMKCINDSMILFKKTHRKVTPMPSTNCADTFAAPAQSHALLVWARHVLMRLYGTKDGNYHFMKIWNNQRKFHRETPSYGKWTSSSQNKDHCVQLACAKHHHHKAKIIVSSWHVRNIIITKQRSLRPAGMC